MIERIDYTESTSLDSQYRGHSVLITGANGFVAAHLARRLAELGSTIYGIDVQPGREYPLDEYESCDLLNLDAVSGCIERWRPDFVFHLASQSSVGTSWQHEWETIDNNVRSTHNLFRVLSVMKSQTSVLLVSSGEVYGNIGRKRSSEKDSLKPMNPYAVSKAMMEMIAHRFKDGGMRYVIARSYNHTGPGRPDNYFESSVARQFALARKARKNSCTLTVGNINNVRDYSDVRDVVEKYLLLLVSGNSGEAYNVCTGKGIELKQIITLLENLTHIRAEIELDEGRLRKNDIPFLVGASRIRHRGIPLKKTFSDLVDSFL